MKKIRGLLLILGSILLVLCGKSIRCEARTSVTVTTLSQLAINCATGSDTEIILGNDIQAWPQLVVKGTKTINGNGHKIIRDGDQATKYLFEVSEGNSLELKNLTYDGNKVYVKYGFCEVKAGGTLKFGTNVNFYGSKIKTGGVITDSGTVIMSGGTIRDNTTDADGTAILVTKGGKLTVNGGTILNNHAKLNGGGIFASQYGSCFINGGTIKNNSCDGGQGHGIFAGKLQLSGTPNIDLNNDICIQKTDSLAFNNYKGSLVAINFAYETTGTDIFTQSLPVLNQIIWSNNYKNADLHPLTACTIGGKNKICVGGYINIAYKVDSIATCNKKEERIRWADLYGKFPEVKREGYTVTEWSTTATNQKPVTDIVSNQPCYLTSDITLYPIYKQNSYQIKFDSNGGSDINEIRLVKYDEKYGVLPIPYRTGYTFEGWYSDKEGTLQYKESDQVKLTKDIVAYAKWKPITCQITFDTQGGTAIPSKLEVTYDSKFGPLPIPIREGYKFCGWYNAVDGGVSYHEDDLVNTIKDTTLYARWEKQSVTIKLDANGGTSSIKSKEVKFNETLGKLPTPVRSGYIFNGWYTSKTAGKKYTEKTVIIDGQVNILYAHWIKNDVQRITVKGLKTTYFKGSKISTKGMVLTAYYRNGTSKKITKGYKINSYSKAAGKRTITITYANKSCKVTCSWYDQKQFDKIKLTHAKSSVYIGQSKQLKISSKYGVTGNVSYKSSNKKIATIDKNGKITAKKSGTVKVTATITINNHKKKLTYTLNVKKSEIKIGFSYCSNVMNLQFKAKAKGCVKKFVWRSSNTNVGTIDPKTGFFTAKHDGITYITVKSGNVASRKIKVTVKKKSVQCY
ncbi:MAG: InlB B-repeat-containing protein [bacterium]|nr:InlB B-repeat-containing protein [bacterium]